MSLPKILQNPLRGNFTHAVNKKCITLYESCNLQKLFEERNDTGEVTFTFPEVDETIKAHKVVLAAHSDVFKAMLFGSIHDRKKNITIEITDLSYDIVSIYLSFVYNRPYYWDKQYSFWNEATIFQAYYIAHKYNNEKMMRSIFDDLVTNLDKENFLQVLELSIFFEGSKRLKNSCEKAFYQMNSECIFRIFQSDDRLLASKEALFETIHLMNTTPTQIQADHAYGIVSILCKDALDKKDKPEKRIDFWNKENELFLALDFNKLGINNFLKFQADYDIFPLEELRRILAQFIV